MAFSEWWKNTRAMEATRKYIAKSIRGRMQSLYQKQALENK